MFRPVMAIIRFLQILRRVYISVWGLIDKEIIMKLHESACNAHHQAYTTIKKSLYRVPRRNGKNFGRVFRMLNYTDITQNTYIQSWTVTDIMAWEECGHLAFPRTVRLQLSRIDLDSGIKAVISVTARAPPNAIRQYFITARYPCAM